MARVWGWGEGGDSDDRGWGSLPGRDCDSRCPKRDDTGCSPSETVTQAPQKSPSNTGGLVKSLPPPSLGGPVVSVQLDHPGRHHSDEISESKPAVHTDIRKNEEKTQIIPEARNKVQLDAGAET